MAAPREEGTPAPQPYTMWRMDCAFRKTGSPIVGNMGTTYRSVVIMETSEFQRLLSEHPSLTAENVKYNIGSLE